MRALSKVAPEWWDYTTLDRELLDDAAAEEFASTDLGRRLRALDWLLARRIDRQKKFDAGELPDFLPAVRRILAALEARETILVHGDYDVDGMAGVTLLTRFLRGLGGKADPFVPHRLRDGYDLGPAGLQAAEAAGARGPEDRESESGGGPVASRTFRIRRHDPDAGGDPVFREYTLDVTDGMTVLELSELVKELEDKFGAGCAAARPTRGWPTSA